MSEYGIVLKKAFENQLLEEKEESCVFIDLDAIDFFLDKIKSAFPDSAKHYIPIKTNPLNAVQKHILSKGFGLEASSITEVRLAKLNGARAEQIVLNSPAKGERFYAKYAAELLNLNIHLNDLEELSFFKEKSIFKQILRINPLTKSSSQKEFFVSSDNSKFGHQVIDRDKFIEDVIGTSICALHVHQASSFLNFEEHIVGIRFVVDLALEINKKSTGKISLINIGGGFQGLPVEMIHIFDEYITALKKSCPELFDGTFTVATEFGRFVYKNSAFLYATIASIKNNGTNTSIVINAGANLFLREVYSATKLTADQLVLLGTDYKTMDTCEKFSYNIDGPLCFAGDRLYSNVLLPKTSVTSTLIIKDIGANTFSLYSMHCSKPFPKVIAYSSSKMEIIKEEQSMEELYTFWGK